MAVERKFAQALFEYPCYGAHRRPPTATPDKVESTSKSDDVISSTPTRRPCRRFSAGRHRHRTRSHANMTACQMGCGPVLARHLHQRTTTTLPTRCLRNDPLIVNLLHPARA